jgi:hypothetical protein
MSFDKAYAVFFKVGSAAADSDALVEGIRALVAREDFDRAAARLAYVAGYAQRHFELKDEQAAICRAEEGLGMKEEWAKRADGCFRTQLSYARNGRSKRGEADPVAALLKKFEELSAADKRRFLRKVSR